MENPIKMDDLGVPPFPETPMYIFRCPSLMSFQAWPLQDMSTARNYLKAQKRRQAKPGAEHQRNRGSCLCGEKH